jgi:hypothetical protein
MDSGSGEGSAAVLLVLSDLVAGASELAGGRLSSKSEQSFESEQGFMDGFSVCSELLMAAPWTAIASPWCDRMRLNGLLDEVDAPRASGPT